MKSFWIGVAALAVLAALTGVAFQLAAVDSATGFVPSRAVHVETQV